MHLLWACEGAAAGLTAGAASRGAVFRLSVAACDPDRETCLACGAPLRAVFPIRCGHCGTSLGPPAVLELATAAVLATLAARFGGQPALPAFCLLGVLGVALSAIDIAVRRLPDRLVLPAYPATAVLLATSAAAQRDPGALARALAGGAVLAGVYLMLAVARPGQLGAGDIKLAGLAGLVLGWLGWSTLASGAALGFLLAGLASAVLLALRRVAWRGEICFGPFLLGGAFLAMLASRP